ncbi:MAG: hypothetical protein JWQ94_2290 [Tardiphaga sp.]|nr:hypothetical protein [Tardiphaga sp.]
MNVHTTDINKRISQHCETQSFSFDIFDTFIIRACTTPEGVFTRAFQLSPAFQLFPDSLDAYVQHRKQSEARARRAAFKRSGAAEVTIEQIYRLFPYRLFGLQRSDLPDLVQAEFDAELSLCRAHPEMLRKYLDIRAAGARTGFISDTYWSVAQLAALLRSCHPGLRWDFLYSSSESGTSKIEELFAVYLAEQSLTPAAATHLGDNPLADIKGAHRHGIAALHYPQATDALTSIFSRETTVAEMLCPGASVGLDDGLRTLRRVVASQSAATSSLHQLGLTVLGPVLHAFDAFIADRVAQIEREHGRTAIAFLGRDGLLSHSIWREMRDTPASYVAINRRVSLMGAAATLDPLIELLNRVPAIDAATFLQIVKMLPPAVAGFFDTQPGGVSSGSDLADELPDLIEADEIGALAAGLRAELMGYLRRQIADFDACENLIVVDIGYSGTIQKALRQIFDLEQLPIRLHGLYLLTMDEAADDIAEPDSFEGFISGLVVTPHVKHMLVRNAMVLEQMCCAATGSVRNYHDGEALYEDNPQPPGQIALAQQVQAGAIGYAAAAVRLAPACGFEPLANLATAARSAAAILGRWLLLPTDDELQLLGSFTHDINLGTLTLAPMVDIDFTRTLQVAQAFPLACTANNPPMWPAASFSALTPVHNYLYFLFGTNRLPSDIFGDVKCGQIAVGMFAADGSSSLLDVSCFRTAFGDLRLRIPVARSMAIGTVVVPIAQLAREALLTGPFLHGGKKTGDALHSADFAALPEHCVSVAGMVRNGRYVRATQDDGALVITLPPPTAAVTIISIGLTPLNGERIMAL